MDLWIRSQKKWLLLKVDNIAIQEETNNIVTINNKMPFILGKYKTEKRALEVLNEIEKFLQPTFKLDSIESDVENGKYQEFKLYFREPNIFQNRIYQMPEC